MFSEESLRSFDSEDSVEMMKQSVAVNHIPTLPEEVTEGCQQNLENIELNVKDILEKFYQINFNA